MLVALVFSLPFVQNYTAKQASDYLNSEFDLQLSLRKFQYSFPNRIHLEGVFLPDFKGDTLFYVGALDADFMAYNSISSSLRFQRVIGDSLYCYMTSYEDGQSMSRFIESITSDEESDPNANFNLRVSALALSNSRYYLREKPQESDLHFLWRAIDGEMQDFFVSGREVGGEIDRLSFNDPQGLKVEDLRASVIYGDKGIRASNLEFTTSRGYLSGDIDLIYQSPSAYLSYIDSVYMQGRISQSSVHPLDVKYFSPLYPDFPSAEFSGIFHGYVNDLRLDSILLRARQDIRLEGDLRLSDLSEGKALKFRANDLSIQANGQEIKEIAALFNDKSLPEFIEDDELFRWQGTYEGGLYDFRTKSSLSSALAQAELDIEIQNLSDFDKVQYKGELKLDYLDIRSLSGIRDLGMLSATLDLDGSGIDPASMRSGITGRIDRFEYLNYAYSNLSVNGAIEDGFFDGEFLARDPNMNFDFNGKASFIADTAQFDFRLKVDSAKLYAVHLVDDSLAQYKGFMDIDFRALNYDDWEGQIALRESQYHNARKEHYIQDIELVSMNVDTSKQLLISSDIMEGRLYGTYTLSGLQKVFTQSFQRFLIPGRYQEKDSLNYQFQYDLEFKNTGLLSQLLVPKLLVEPGTKISGTYGYSENGMQIDFQSRAIRYDQHLFENISLDYNSAEGKDELEFNLDQYHYKESEVHADSLSLICDFESDSLDYRLSLILRDSIDTYANFNGIAELIDTNAYLINFKQGDFNLGERNFVINPSSQLKADTSGLEFKRFEVKGEELGLNLSGFISEDPNKILRAEIEDLNLELLDYFIANEKANTQGYLNASIIATELLTEAKFLSDISVDTLILNDVVLGKFELVTDFDYISETVYLDGGLSLGSLKSLDLLGFYQTSKKGEMNIDFDFNRFRLAALEPFASPIAEDLRGIANGKVSLRGPVNKPEIDGELQLPKTALKVSFLQTDYNLVDNPRILINNERIAFPDLQLRDTQFGTQGVLRGEVRHQNFKQFYIDLSFLADELLVLNTTSEISDAYYGTAYASGSIDIKGPPSKVKVEANVSSARKTNFNIPIGGATKIQDAGYVKFIAPQDDSNAISIADYEFELDEGVSLDFDIDVNPDASVSIILNESTGNKLNANGSGLIKLKLEPNEDLKLYGTYTVNRGAYQFNIEGLFRKDFLVEQGGTVVWDGDPYEARLDLTAVYTTKANPGVITGESNAVVTPVDVKLYITGVLTNPEISFDVDMPRASSSTQAILSNRLNTDQAINQQVFSLLAFNSFTPPSNFLAGAGTGLNQWDIIANQAAAFLNRFTGDYRVSLSYQPAVDAGQDATAGPSNEELEVGLSKNFLNERLTVNSSVEVPLNENNNGIAGDFELIYSLTEDGRVRAKAFNRSVDNRFSINLGQQQLYQQGVGISFNTDFDTYGELWKRILGKARKEEESEAQEKAD